MANQDDTLIDMPLLEEVLDNDDNDDDDDDDDDEVDNIPNKSLTKLSVSENSLTMESNCENVGDSMKSSLKLDDSKVDNSEKGEELHDGEPNVANVEPENQQNSSDSTPSSESDNENHHSIECNATLKDESRRFSSPSTSTGVQSNINNNNSSSNLADGASRVSDDSSSGLTHHSRPISSSHESLSLSTSDLDPFTNHPHQQRLDSDSCENQNLDGVRTDSVGKVNNPSENSRPTSTSSIATRGSTSSRLLSSDSQDSIVTVEVIPIPRSAYPVESAFIDSCQQDSILSVTEEDNSTNTVEGEEEQQGQQEEEETTISTSYLETEEEEEEEEEVSTVDTEVVEMSDQQRLEEKLRQFENDAKEREKEGNVNTEGTVQMSESEKQRRRNLIFDEERFEETFLKCLICREVYNETDKLPKMLHCHHTFCMDCLYQMYRVEGEFRQSLTSVFRNMPLTVKIQCPTCREGIIISEAELRRLPNDHTIMELLCFVNKTGKNDVQYCPKHQMQPLNFFCEPCIMPVCCDCTVLDHKESKGHRVVNVDEAMKKYTPIVEDTLNDIRKEKTSLAGKREALENTQEDLNRIQAGISDQIRKVFDSIREVLDERERELHDVAVSEVERKQGVIEGHLNTIADREADLNTEFNSLQIATDDKDISLIFTGHKSARDLLSRKVFIPTNSTAGFSITFQFSSRADTVIKQQVANLGDVIFHS